MIDFTIDTLDLSEEFNLSRKDIDQLLEYTVKEVTFTFARLWETEARNKLKKSRSQYLRAIQIDSRGPFVGVAYLNPASWIANAVEIGADAFDIKQGLLNSPKAKTSSKGSRYITVPFRFATPQAIGDNELFSGIMPEDIYRAAMNQQKLADSDQGSKGLKLADIPSQYQIPKSAALRKDVKHTQFQIAQGTKMTSIYEGLQREASGSGWVNFRRVSDNSEEDSFQHPGIEPRDLATHALSGLDIPHIVDLSIDNFLSKKGF